MGDQVQVVICDDDAGRVQDWKERVEAALASLDFAVAALPPVEFAAGVKALNERAIAAKAGDWTPGEDAASVFDHADILVLDSDLTPDATASQHHDPTSAVETYLAGETGSEVARLARAFTHVGAIAVVNEGTKSRTFDLTMMRTAKGLADVYITEEDLDNPQLWRVDGVSSYRPWAWPLLTQLPNLFNEITDESTLETSVLECLGLDFDQTSLLFSNKQLEALSSDADDIERLTLMDVARTADYGLGLHPKEKTSKELLLRVGVCGLRRWLDRVVVPQQNILVDLPHLLQSSPWLVADRDNLGSWNERRSWWHPAQPSVATEAHNQAASRILGRNVWNVHELPPRPRDGRIRLEDPVFCEDTSDFRSSDDASDFISDIEGPFAARFVANLADIDYSPHPRLLK